MQILNPKFDLSRFFEQVRERQSRALLLDYDGTLAPFREARNKAYPYPSVKRILPKILAAKSSRVVLISGRQVKDLVPLLGLRQTPEIWGSHGLERLQPNGEYRVAELDERTSTTLERFARWAEKMGWSTQCEAKPGAIALHWRDLSSDQTREIKERVHEEWNGRLDDFGLTLKDFDGGVELRVSEINKGQAVERVLSEMDAKTATAYLGDDLTDEDAFETLQDRGAKVLVRTELRPTAADMWLVPPEELVQFLTDWYQACINGRKR